MPLLSTVLIVLLGSAFAATVAFWLSQRLTRPLVAGSVGAAWGAFETPHLYVFRDGYLVSDIGAEDVFLPKPEDRAGAWVALSEVLAQVNPRVPSEMDHLRRSGRAFLLMGQAGADALSISGEAEGDTIRIKIANALAHDGKLVVDADSFRRHRSETEILRRTIDSSPVISWRESADGAITWANATYVRFLEQKSGQVEEIGWPLPQLFGRELRPLPEPGQSRRCGLALSSDDTPVWFEVAAVPLGAETLIMAQPAERLVAAEDALREFVQTLSKTFADLPIGLAIFDRRRELVLFNPALVTLSTLDVQFLSSRPTLHSFLDGLRENRHMPEPKNYKAWRESIAKLEADAVDGSFHDLWTLPSGQTYRVIGRPHPDGAIAFMFEDISGEVSLTRQFRADLDLYQDVLDSSDEALAVFSAQGQLVQSNAAYADLWGHDPREMLGSLSLREASSKWEAKLIPAPLWGEIRDFAEERQERETWSDQLLVPGRGRLLADISPLRGGASLIRFTWEPSGHSRSDPAGSIPAGAGQDTRSVGAEDLASE